MHITIEIMGMSPNMRIRNAWSANMVSAVTSKARTPDDNFKSFPTSSQRKESKSLGFLGPGMTPIQMMC
jgi:hypothetical protein